MKRILALILGLTLCLSVIGCSSKTTSSNVDNAKGDTETTDEKVASNKKSVDDTEVVEGNEDAKNMAKDRKGAEDTFIVGCNDLTGLFLPFFSDTQYDGFIDRIIFDGLMKGNKEGKYIPNMVESYELTNENRTYTFKLKEGVTFSDGTPLTTKDVAFSFAIPCDPSYDGSRGNAVDNLLGYEEYHSGDATEIKGIEIIDDHTIAFTFVEARPNNISTFAHGILPEHVYKYDKGDIASIRKKIDQQIFVGSGRYKFKTYEQTQFVSLERNDNWFDGVPKIKNIIVKCTTAETMFQELKAGSIDYQYRTPANNDNQAQIEQIGCLNINKYPENGYAYIGVNLRDERLKDVKVRQALMYGYNRKGFIDMHFNGNANTCNAPISQVSWAYPDEDKLNQYEYNPEKAIELLEEAGWLIGEDGIREKDGMKLIINHATSTDSRYNEALITTLMADWEKIGVKLVPNVLDWGALIDAVYYSGKYEFDTYNMSWGLSNDPDATAIFHSKSINTGAFNSVGLRDDEIDRLLEEGAAEFDQEKRAAIYQEYAIRMNEILPYLFVTQTTDWDVSNNRVLNLNISPYCDWVDIIHDIELER